MGYNVKNFLSILVTGAIVSLDSFVAGFSLSLNKKSGTMLPSAVAFITLLLCLLTTLIRNILERHVEQYVNFFGAALLLLLAVFSLIRKDEEQHSLTSVTLGESLTIGVAVGMDAAVANLSLTLNGAGLIAPILFAVMHYFTVLLGQLFAQKVVLKHTNVLSAVILIALAISKLI